jgi:hypothetical protein
VPLIVAWLFQRFDKTCYYHPQVQRNRTFLSFRSVSTKLAVTIFRVNEVEYYWSLPTCQQNLEAAIFQKVSHVSVSPRVLFGSDMGLSELFTTISNRWHVCVGSWWGHYRSGTSNEGRAAKIPMCVVSGSERFVVGGSLGASCRLSTRSLRKNFPEDRKMPHFQAQRLCTCSWTLRILQHENGMDSDVSRNKHHQLGAETCSVKSAQ